MPEYFTSTSGMSRCEWCIDDKLIPPIPGKNYCDKCRKQYCRGCTYRSKLGTYPQDAWCDECKSGYKCVSPICKETTKRKDKHCDQCYKIRDNLVGTYSWRPSTSEVQVVVTYAVQKEEHDGFCSDHYNDRFKQIEEISKYKLPLVLVPFISERLLCVPGDSVPQGMSWYFKKRKIVHGSGECGMATSFSIMNIEVY